MGTAFFAIRKRKNRKAAGEEGEKNIQIVSYPEFWRKLPRDHPNIWKSI